MEDYQRVLLVKNDVQVFKIPPKTTGRAYRASEWNLDAPDWACRLRLIAVGKKCFIKLDEKNTGQFFGQCPIESYTSDSVEPVSDSSRYFVLKLVNEDSGRSAFVGIGFIDRSDSFDLNVALQDHFKILKHEEEDNDDSKQAVPKLDLGFKDGQTIKVNLNIKKKPAATKPKGTIGLGLGGILLPPPPGGKSAPAVAAVATTTASNTSSSASGSKDLIKNLENLNLDNSQCSSDDSKDSTPKDDKSTKNNVNLLLDFGAFESSTSSTKPVSSNDNFSSSPTSSSATATTTHSNWANFD